MRLLAEDIEKLLIEWEEQPNQSKAIINFLLTYLTDDVVWLKRNISSLDKEILKEIVSKL